MGTRLVGKKHNHKTAAAAFDYQIKDHKALGFGSTVAIYRGDGTFIGRVDKKQFVAFAKGRGLTGEKLRRNHPRASQGELLSLTVPAEVAGAMKLSGRLQSPKQAFRLLAPGLKAAMKKVNDHAYGRTTGGAPIKGDVYYAVFAGHTNRSGELALQANVWLFPTVRAATRKHFALASRPIAHAQQKIKSAWHMGVADALYRDAGILCGPKGHSFVAYGVNAKTKRSAEMKAKVRATRFRGNKARQRAAQESRQKKKTVSWADAVQALKAAATGTVQRTAKTISDKREA